MKKHFSLFLIIVLCLTVVVGTLGCNNDIDDGSNDESIVQLPADDNPNTDDDEDIGGDPVEIIIPRAEYTRETIDGVSYIYYGSMPQKAISTELNNVLANLVETSQLLPDENGNYLYGDVSYTMVRGTEVNAGRKLSNGLTVEDGGYYFFTTEKLRWRVLEESDGEALLLCETVIGSSCFNPTNSYNSLGYMNGSQISSNDYAESALRDYVIDTLYYQIFTLREKQSILEKYIVNRPGESTYPLWQGLDTSSKDKIFILSYWQATKEEYGLMVDENQLYANPISDYVLMSGITAEKVGDKYYSDWWLRTCGNGINFGSRATFNGVVGTAVECSVNLDYRCGVRPAIYLKT